MRHQFVEPWYWMKGRKREDEEEEEKKGRGNEVHDGGEQEEEGRKEDKMVNEVLVWAFFDEVSRSLIESHP